MSYAITVPTTGSISVAGTATLDTVNDHSFSFANAADVTFNGSIAAATLKGAFVVSGSSTSDQNFAVTRAANTSALASALSSAIQGAISAADGYSNANNASPFNPKNLQNYLLNLAQHDMDTALETDNIAASLSAVQMGAVALTDLADACDSGASDLVDAISDAHAATIALQYDNARWEPQGTADSTLSTEIPFLSGDTVTFRFYISQTYTVSASPDTVTGAAAVSAPGAGMAVSSASAGQSAGVTQGSGPSVVSSGYSVGSKICDFVLTLS
jgi:hypothetical protein